MAREHLESYTHYSTYAREFLRKPRLYTVCYIETCVQAFYARDTSRWSMRTTYRVAARPSSLNHLRSAKSYARQMHSLALPAGRAKLLTRYTFVINGTSEPTPPVANSVASRAERKSTTRRDGQRKHLEYIINSWLSWNNKKTTTATTIRSVNAILH